jgi:hypothetical protein
MGSPASTNNGLANDFNGSQERRRRDAALTGALGVSMIRCVTKRKCICSQKFSARLVASPVGQFLVEGPGDA